jgi:outer-membrane receptor for ferric coprogen and ferric-rhodotorulic acid
VHSRRLLCITIIVVAWMPRLVSAADSDQPVKCNLKINSQPLGAALQEFAKQCDVQVVFFSKVTEGLQGPPLSASYTIAGALQILLSGSHLTFRVINPKTIAILNSPAPDPSDNPSGSAANGRKPKAAADEANDRDHKAMLDSTTLFNDVVVIGTAEDLVGTRTETPLREIPQTLSIISREQIQQENYTDLADALVDAIGITPQRSSSLDWVFYSRGFQVSTFHLDGGAALNSFDLTAIPFLGEPHMGEFERIEVLRGADGLFGGEGSPGATVNLVRKVPLSTPQLTVDLSGGSWDNYRVEADATGPLGFDGALRGRVDVDYLDRRYFFKTANLDGSKIFGVLEWDLSPQTLLTVGGSIQWDNTLPIVAGLPRDPDDNDAHLPRSTGLTSNWANYDTHTREIYLQFTQHFGPRWKLKINATSWDVTARYDLQEFAAGYGPLLYPDFEFTTRPNTQNQLALDTTFTGSFDVFGRRVDLAVGADLLQFRGISAVDEPISSAAPINVHAFSPAAYPDPRLSNLPVIENDSRVASNQPALFGSIKVNLNSALSIIGGARVNRNSASTVNFSRYGDFSDSGTHGFETPTKAAPYVGTVYNLNRNYSLYASYAEVYLSNGLVKSAAGSYLPPIQGSNMEMGLKGAWRDNTLNAAFALYDIEQKNLPLEDVAAEQTSAGFTYGCCFTAGGSIRSKGADLELSGRLAPGWLIGAGYNYNVSYGNPGADSFGETPVHLLKVWTSKELAGLLSRWAVGGSVRAQSATSSPFFACPGDDPFYCTGPPTLFKTVQGSYAIVGLRVSYEIDSHWHAGLNITNIFDRIYYQTPGNVFGGAMYGEPRAFTLRIDGKF